jgi:hypothetical protein
VGADHPQRDTTLQDAQGKHQNITGYIDQVTLRIKVVGQQLHVRRTPSILCSTVSIVAGSLTP